MAHPKAPAKLPGAVARVWQIADAMPEADPKTAVAACVAAGIHRGTAQVQYAKWHKAHFGMTPRERAKALGQGAARGEDDVPVRTSARYADGWRSAFRTVQDERVEVITAPDGTTYTLAPPEHPADLIVDYSGTRHREMKRVRLSRFTDWTDATLRRTPHRRKSGA